MNPAAIALAVLAWYAAKQPEPADLIMARVALNQDRAQQMRSAFVYHQNMLIRFKRSNHKPAREEQREYVVTPTEKGFAKTLKHVAGKYDKGGKLFDYNEPDSEHKRVAI